MHVRKAAEETKDFQGFFKGVQAQISHEERCGSSKGTLKSFSKITEYQSLEAQLPETGLMLQLRGEVFYCFLYSWCLVKEIIVRCGIVGAIWCLQSNRKIRNSHNVLVHLPTYETWILLSCILQFLIMIFFPISHFQGDKLLEHRTSPHSFHSTGDQQIFLLQLPEFDQMFLSCLLTEPGCQSHLCLSMLLQASFWWYLSLLSKCGCVMSYVLMGNLLPLCLLTIHQVYKYLALSALEPLHIELLQSYEN